MTVAALLPVVLALLWLGGWFFASLMALAAGLASHEYYRMVLDRRWPEAALGTATAALLPLVPVAAGQHTATAILVALGMLSLATWIVQVGRGPDANVAARAGHVLVGCWFTSIGMVCLTVLRLRGDGLQWAVAVMMATWVNDAGGYFVGHALGKTKLNPRVSPGKTWEGAIGAWIVSTAVLLASQRLLLAELSLVDGLVLGAIAGVAGPLGDLSKSLVKRASGVKDAGRLLPGHGGMLDRIDALLFNAQLAWLYSLWRG